MRIYILRRQTKSNYIVSLRLFQLLRFIIKNSEHMGTGPFLSSKNEPNEAY